MNNHIRVLIVEDNPDDAELMLLELELSGYSVIWERVENIREMSAALDRQNWDMILADYSLPQFNALAALSFVQEKNLDLPFIIVSGSIGEEIAVAAMRAGAHDYLLKNSLSRLVPAAERELREAQIRQERRQALQDIQTLAFYDELTGLPNRTLFLQDLQNYIDEYKEQPSLFGVVFLDIDRYRSVKYGFGHIKSNQFLIKVAQRLAAWMQPTDSKVSRTNGGLLARVGEDAFGLLFKDLLNLDELSQKVTQIHQILQLPFQVDKSLIYSSVSIGVVDSTMAYNQAEEFLRAADTATYNAKKQLINTVVFNSQMQTEELERLRLEADLQQAIKEQKLHLNYQPIICLNTNKVIGFEALVRWYHEERGWVSPEKFIPLAEQTGLIIPLGEWVLTETCRQINLWEKALENSLPLSVAVNLSGVQLTQANLVSVVENLYHSFCSNKIYFKLEVTESVLMKNGEVASEALAKLRANGIQICIDDFGTGYSSLAYLHILPIDFVKIDRSFVIQMTEDAKNLDIVETIITLAHRLDLKVIAEGVETERQKEILRSLGCEYGQGYFFSKPLSPNAIINWIASWGEKEDVVTRSHNWD
ncbi:GGDEF domain-containing response regulator [[Phormidium ambiguum] IAM M-71]|uniref:GGDEF domain-containing response regulator n=2 Tax=[Phormidium ambiguum] IAM M-71 TaxID=454136 RepID=A0A1U7IQC4_9CYAN|nr:GGDEF domain-containing response regulator [Phormidium ambiguum IAM M-71]